MGAAFNLKPATWLVVAALIGPVIAGARSSGQAALPAASSATTAPSLPSIPDRVFRVTDYGAVGDGKTEATGSLNAAIAACAKAGGGTVDFPPGRFLTRPFLLASNLNLHLTAGAALLLATDPKDYEEPGKRNRNGITADDCHDIAVTGSGTIDGQGGTWWPRYVKTYAPPPGTLPPMHRPYMLTFSRCTRVLVEGVTLTNSPSFHLVPAQCRDVTLRNIRILAPANAPNTDGIDPSGWDYLITGCTIDVGDDNIALKPTGKIAPDQPSCRNFVIEHCAFRHGHGMSIGGQTSGGLENLLVRDCTFEDTQAGIRMKAGRGSGGLSENLVYERLTMKRVKVPIYISSYYPRVPDDPATDPAQPVAATTPIWRHIRIQDLTVTDSPEAGRIIGLAEAPVEDIEFINVRIAAAKGMQVVHTRGIRFIRSDVLIRKAPSIRLPTPATAATKRGI